MVLGDGQFDVAQVGGAGLVGVGGDGAVAERDCRRACDVERGQPWGRWRGGRAGRAGRGGEAGAGGDLTEPGQGGQDGVTVDCGVGADLGLPVLGEQVLEEGRRCLEDLGDLIMLSLDQRRRSQLAASSLRRVSIGIDSSSAITACAIITARYPVISPAAVIGIPRSPNSSAMAQVCPLDVHQGRHVLARAVRQRGVHLVDVGGQRLDPLALDHCPDVHTYGATNSDQYVAGVR
jgi:hypothetical protein